jgi:acetyltransferase-like isoleucine patch superfamily enzyme
MNAPGRSMSHGPHPHAPQGHGTVREVLEDGRTSAFARYRRLTLPDAGVGRFVLFELATMFLLPAGGALGLALRRALLRPFFGAFGRNVIIGRHCLFRHPERIFIGDSVTIDDHCLLDARGCGAEGLRIEDHTIVSRGCSIKSKAGPIHIGRDVNIGSATHLVSHGGIEVGDGVAIAGGCNITGGTFDLAEFARPPPQRMPVSHGPIEIGAGAWLATSVTVVDAVRIGEGAVVAAGSVVTHSVAPRTVVQGNPAAKVFSIP